MPAVSISVLQDTDRQSITSDAQGRFAAVVTHGTVRLIASKDGYTGIYPEGRRQPSANGVLITVRPGQPLRGVVLPIFPMGSVSGRVFDARSRPVAFAQAQLWRFTYDDEGERVFRPVELGRGGQTNNQGEFRIEAVPPGEYFLYVKTPVLSERTPGESWLPVFHPSTSNPSRAQSLAVKAGADTRVDDITMMSVRGGTIRIRISNKTGQSIQSDFYKLLYWRRQDDDKGDIVRVPLLSLGGREKAEIPVPPGKYDIVVGYLRPNLSAIGFGHAVVEVGQSNVDVDVAIVQGGRVREEIMLEQSTVPAKSAGNVRCDLIHDAFGRFTATAAADGSLTITDLPPVEFRVLCSDLPADTFLSRIQQDDRDVLQDGLLVVSDTESSLRVTLAVGGVVEGTVSNSNGQRASFAIAALVPEGPQRNAKHLYRFTDTDQEGTFRIQAVPPGAYRVFAWSDLDGAAHKNSEFIRPYEEQGTLMTVERSGRTAVTTKLLVPQ